MMSSKNRTYERALSAFFGESSLSDEQRERLPSDVDGLSVRRKKMIQAVLDAPSPTARLNALKRLDKSFGLPSDLSVLSAALIPEEPALAVKALRGLAPLLNEEPLELLLSHRERLIERLRSLEIRLFHDEGLTLTQRCLTRLRSLPSVEGSSD